MPGDLAHHAARHPLACMALRSRWHPRYATMDDQTCFRLTAQRMSGGKKARHAFHRMLRRCSAAGRAPPGLKACAACANTGRGTSTDGHCCPSRMTEMCILDCAHGLVTRSRFSTLLLKHRVSSFHSSIRRKTCATEAIIVARCKFLERPWSVHSFLQSCSALPPRRMR